MKTHTSNFKNAIKDFGREIDSKITYISGNETIELGVEELNSVTPHYEGSLLKSVMKQLDIDSNTEIPTGTLLNYQFGIKTGEDENNDPIYEYINFGNYIVKEVEEQKDTNSYLIKCYDKLLLSMVDYEDIGVVYPITIRNYIDALCHYLGITFKNTNNNFTNYNKEIPFELYLDSEGNSIGYTFRDVFDELAQVTGSTICINENDNELEIRYINNTNDTITEEYLKDINVNFGEKYGPINSIVLSRSADSDIVYLRDEESITENGLCELKIKDNQIMNRNDRDTYLTGLLAQLDGTEFYINDFVSTGIGYYNLCDKYNISINNETYSCLMLNDEFLVTQGLQENIHTDLLEESETDYTKADKTDRKINQTYIIVDKQNQVIESVVSNVTTQNNKISQITQTVDELNAKISDIADVTISGETDYASLQLNNINASEPVMLKVHPNSVNISYLYPRDNLYPSDTLYSTIKVIRFHNETTNEDIDYELPDNLFYYNSTTYDEFYLDNESQTCQITKKCGINADGTTYALSTAQVVSYDFPTIPLTDGNYTISVLGYDTAYIFVRLMTANIYTTQFATKVELQTAITQTESEISLEVDQKTSTEELISKINLSPGNILLEGTVTANDNFKILQDGSIEAKNGSFSGDVYLGDGGKVIGGQGILANFQFIGKAYGMSMSNTMTDPSGGFFLGFNGEFNPTTNRYDYFKGYHCADVYIPEGFTVEKAYITVIHRPIEYSGSSGSGTGYVRNLRAYDLTGEFGSNAVLTDYEYYFASAPTLNSSTEIAGAFGTNGHTFNGSQEETYNSNDISSIFTDSGNYSIVIASGNNAPASTTTKNITRFGPFTGFVTMYVNVIGYMATSEES